MDCTTIQSKFNSFLRGTIKSNELRKLYYHVVKCSECKEALLDEFSFYMTFNDLDKELDFNYEKKLNEFLEKVYINIENDDNDKINLYRLISIVICIVLAVLVAIAIILVNKK